MARIKRKFVEPPAIESKAANFTAAFEKIYIVTGNLDVQLPNPATAGATGKQIVVKKIGSQSVNLVRHGTEKIDNVAATKALTSTQEAVSIITDGTDWFII